MNTPLLLPAAALAALALLAGCASHSSSTTATAPAATGKAAAAPTRSAPSSGAWTVNGYKRDVAEHISGANAARVYGGRPQPLLRSVVVLRYTVDARGQVVSSNIVRSNHDRETETAALHSLRNASPLPRPASHLLRNGQLDIVETWLFNDDGRFQLRTIAEPQMDS